MEPRAVSASNCDIYAIFVSISPECLELFWGSRCSDGERGEVAAQVGGEAAEASGRTAERHIAAVVARRRRYQGRGRGAQDAVVRSHAAAIHGAQGGRHPGAAEEVLESGFVFVLQEACKSVSLFFHTHRLLQPLHL